MVAGGADQAHRPGHVREDLIPNDNRTGPAETRLGPPVRAGCFNGAHPRIAAARTGVFGLSGSRFQWLVGYPRKRFHGGRKQRKDK